MNKELQKLKVSLNEAIQSWIDKEAETDSWDAIVPNMIGDNTSELMTDSAFNILLAQIDVQKYLEREFK